MAVQTRFDKKGGRSDYPYYRQVWIKVVLFLLTAALFPLIVIGGGVTSYIFNKLEMQLLDDVRHQVRAHQLAIDNFLDERERGLKMMAALHSLEELTAPGRLDSVFNMLNVRMPGFQDLGVIDMKGRHLAYTGSYALASQNYKGEAWFLSLAERDSYISDVFTGFRKIPHFIIAVKQGRGDDAFILRATVDSNRFDQLVAEGLDNISADSFIVNRNGLFQTTPRQTGELLGHSGIHPDPETKAIEISSNGDELTVMLWQEKVPWLNVVRVKSHLLYADLDRSRLAVLLTFLIGIGLIVSTVLLTTGNLVRLLEAKGRRLRVLDEQLRRSSYLSATLELSMGFFEEIKDILSNIDASVKWLTGRGPETGPSELTESVSQIAGEASRAHQLVEKFSIYIRDEDPIVTEVYMNDLLDDLLSFMQRMMAHRDIQIDRDFQKSLPALRSDRRKLRQVFQNLLLNAVSALKNGGTIYLTTRAEGNGVTVVISDNGPGIHDTDLARVFEPLYTTKPRGAGLGLSMCRTILDQLGGSISVMSRSGEGAAFTVTLPEKMLHAC